MTEVFFDADDRGAAARQEFERNAACACEKIEGTGGGIEVDVVVVQEDVEEAFLGKVSGRTRLERRRHVEPLVLIFAADDAHLIRNRRRGGSVGRKGYRGTAVHQVQ